MARTLVGILRLVLQQDVTKRAPEINRALAGIEQTASRLGNAPWGAAFERQLQRLKLSPAERAAISQSYGLLARDITGKIGKADLANWRTGVVGHLSSVRAQLVSTGAEAKRTANIFRTMFAGGVIGGLGTYAAYAGVRGGTTAAFEQQRQEANAYFSGLPEGDRDRIKTTANDLSAKYGIFTADMFEVLKEASLSMPSTDIALDAGDTMARLFVSLEAMFGREGALNGLYDLNKMADNAELNLSPEQYARVMEQYMRAQQVLGKDLSPGDMKRAVQYARIAGKTLSEEFLMTWLPIIAAETSGSDAGTQVRASFDQLIAGRASAKAKKRMNELGIMKDGELVGMDLYGENPLLWANEVLLPKLREGGVDTDNMMELGKAIGELTQNRQSSDLLARALLSIEQYKRYAQDRFPQAKGLAAADEIRAMDPFAAVTGMTNSLKNLAAALGEHVVPVIIPAMNGFAGAVETAAAAVRGAEGWEVGLASLATVAAGIGTFKVGSAAFGGIVALTTAGPSLQTAAMMLQGAATSLNGGAVLDAAGGKGKGGKDWLAGLLAWGAGIAIIGGPGVLSELTSGSPSSTEEYDAQVKAQGEIRARLWEMINGVAGLPTQPPRTLDSPFNFPAPIMLGGAQAADIAELDAKAAAAGQSLGGLNGTVSPQVDTKSLEAALDLANRLKAALQGIGNLATGQSSQIRSEINATYADYGVAP